MSCPKCPSSIWDWSECFWELFEPPKFSTRHHDDRHLWRCCHWGLHHRSIAFRWIITLDSDALFDRTVEKEMSFENHHVQVTGSTLVVGTVLTSIWCISVVWHVYLPYPSCAGQVRCFIDFPVHQFPLFFSSSQHFWEHLIPIPFLQRRQHPWHNKDTTRCLNHAWTLVVDQDAASSLPKTCHILPPRCSHPQSSLPSVCPPKHPLPESGHSTAKPSEAPAGCSPHVPNVSDGHSSLQNNLPLR